MHVLMLSMDSTLLTEKIGNSRARHESYAAQLGRISMVICNRQSLPAYESEHVVARATGSSNYFRYLTDGYNLALQFQKEQPIDVITSQDPFLTAVIGLALRRRLNAPLLMQDHSCTVDNRYFVAERPRNRLLQWFARRTLRMADAVRVVNHQEEAACIHRRIPARQVCTIPVAPDITRFLTPASAADIQRWYDRLGFDPDVPIVLWVGRPVTFKNVPMLLRAFARVHAELPSARFVIAGDMEGTAVPFQVRQAGLEAVTCLPGAVAHNDLPALYQIATVYAHSSNYEGFGLVLAEAGAAGLPVVSTDTDGARELVVRDVTGKLVPVGDDAAMASALVELLRQPERAQSMGEQARTHIQENFDEQRLMAAWTTMIKAVANGESPCAF